MYYLIKDSKIIGSCITTDLRKALDAYEIDDDPGEYKLLYSQTLEDSQIIEYLDEIPSWDWDDSVADLFREISDRYGLDFDAYDEYEPLWDDVLSIYNTKY